MSHFKPARKPTSVGKVVLLGIATGGVSWLPLVWLDPIPLVTDAGLKPAAKTATATDAPGSQATRPSMLVPSVASLPPDMVSRSEPLFAQPRHELAAPAADAADELPSTVVPESLKLRPALPEESAEPAAPQSSDHEPAEAAPHSGDADSPENENEADQATAVTLHEQAPVAVASYAGPLSNAPKTHDRQTADLMHELNSTDQTTAAAAAEALTARGFSEQHLALARRLTSPDPQVRARLASELPGTVGIDVRHWLTWLLQDNDAEVRLAALGVLATSGDPATLQRALEIARQDRDPRIQQQLQQLDKMRKSQR